MHNILPTHPPTTLGAVNVGASYILEHLGTSTQDVRSVDAFQLEVSAHTLHQLIAQWTNSGIVLSNNT